MTIICIIDTSVFCNILGIPNKSQQSERALNELEAFIQDDATLLLPMATIYETGNHIAQNGDGRVRRQKALIFIEEVRKAFSGESPWTPTPMQELEEIIDWLADFPDSAMVEVGFGDLSIIKIFDKQCEMHPGRRIMIWSYDNHLSAYQRDPTL